MSAFTDAVASVIADAARQVLITSSNVLTYLDAYGVVQDTWAGLRKRLTDLWVSAVAVFNYRGAWVTATDYAVKDVVVSGGVSYVAPIAHTSGATFAADLAAGKWVVHQGATLQGLAATGGAALIGTIDSETVAAKVAEIKQRGFASFVTSFARQRPVRVLHVGTSIANNSNAASKHFLHALALRYGHSGNKTQFSGLLGGSYDAPFNGWKKQPHAGLITTRARGDSTSSPLVLNQGAVKRIVIRYSKETDGGSFDVDVDGAFNQTINCNGAQSFGNEVVLTWADIGLHTITLHAPASGYAYLESIDFCVDDPGLHIVDGSKGGSALKEYMTQSAPSGAQVAGIPVVGYNGIDGAFGNAAPNTKPDLIISTYTVNDVNGGLASVNANFIPGLARMVAKTRELGIPLVLVVEPAGQYALPSATQYSTFKVVRAAIRSYTNQPHVTVIDWHAACGFDETDLSALEVLAERYYSVTITDINAGVYTGDFIHPNNTCYAFLNELLHQHAGVEPDGRVGDADAQAEQRSFKLSTIPQLPPYSRKLIGLNGFSRALTNSLGRTKQSIVVGSSYHYAARCAEPLWTAADEVDYFRYGATSGLAYNFDNTVTSDEFGPYLDVVSQTATSYTPGEVESGIWTLLLLIGPGTTVLRVNNAANDTAQPVRFGGITYPGFFTTTGQTFVNSTDRPQFYHCTFEGGPGGLMSVSGRIYGMWITPTEFPCIPGRKFGEARRLTPTLLMLDDLIESKTIDQQLYIESVNSKEIEKVCIGRGIYKPMTDTWHALYRVQNRSAVDIRRLTPNGTVTVNAYLESLGGPTISSDGSPLYWSHATPFAAADAGKKYTVCGHVSSVTSNGRQVAIQLYSAGANKFLGLRGDGSWVDDGTANATTPSLMASKGDRNGHPVAFTFGLPDAATLGAFSWALRIANRNGSSTGALYAGGWTLCEGSSATV